MELGFHTAERLSPDVLKKQKWWKHSVHSVCYESRFIKGLWEQIYGVSFMIILTLQRHIRERKKKEGILNFCKILSFSRKTKTRKSMSFQGQNIYWKSQMLRLFWDFLKIKKNMDIFWPQKVKNSRKKTEILRLISHIFMKKNLSWNSEISMISLKSFFLENFSDSFWSLRFFYHIDFKLLGCF